MHKPLLASAIALTLMTLSACGKDPAPAETAAPAMPATPAAGDMTVMNHPTPAAAAEIDLAGIAKAEGGKTVAEIFAEKDQLAGTPVSFRGKVVKTNPEIMGKNWLHVRDGSGEEGSNDLTITTSATLPEVGATVLVTGAVALNKDFGMGYQYPILIEDAEIVVE